MNTIPVLGFGDNARASCYDLLWQRGEYGITQGCALPITASFDRSGYTMLLVVTADYYSLADDAIHPIYENIIINDLAQPYEQIVGGGGLEKQTYRRVTLTNDGITFSEPTALEFEFNNSFPIGGIPYRIYGIR